MGKMEENAQKEQSIVVVDPYCPKDLIFSLKKHGFQLIAVFSRFKPSVYLANAWVSNKSEFSIVFASTKNRKQLIATLKGLKIIAVINGFDTGIKLTLELGNSLKLKNIPNLTDAKFLANKYATGQFLAKYHLFPCRQVKVTANNIAKAIAFANKQIPYPLVIKPTKSAGSFGTTICYTENDLKLAARHLFRTTDVIMGQQTKELVIQQKLTGQEYTLCTVSLHGHHAITAILKYEQGDLYGQNMIRAIDLADPQQSDVQTVIAYAKQIFAAIHYHSGQTATEIMLTPTGPCLIELNPRLAGINVSELMKFCFGITQGEITALAYADEQAFIKKTQQPLKQIAYGKIVFLRNQFPDAFFKQSTLDAIKKLASFKQITLKVNIADKLPITKDIFTITANILLTHVDKKQLADDYQTLLKIETKKELWQNS